MEKEDPKFMRFVSENVGIRDSANLVHEVYAHQAIDDIYDEGRNAVDKEIDQVDDFFLFHAAKHGASADEVELSNLLYERDAWEKNAVKFKEI